MNLNRPLIPEWESIDAVVLAWPHADTDWATWLEETRAVYLTLIEAINAQQAGVIILCPPHDIEDLQGRLKPDARVLIIPASYNDTWVRDYGFLTCRGNHHGHWVGEPVEFQFNGWGGKFNADDDNMVNQRYLASLCHSPLRSSPVIAEGGALEIDGHGHLLSTAQCLLNPKRNGAMSLAEYEQHFEYFLGAEMVTILENGHLEGDDTDGHIDTLVRFTPDKGLVIQAADNRPQDSHYDGLSALCNECQAAFPEHQQFRLPLPEVHNQAGERLPASYANFLICNRSVLLPVYQQPEDAQAIAIMQQAYPRHDIVPINCAPLVQQFGSLHCISMQIPKRTLQDSVLQQLNSGVSIYAV